MKKMKKNRLVVGNWKMNPESSEVAKGIVLKIKRGIKKFSKVNIVLCPPSLFISDVSRLCRDSKISLGAQDVFWEQKGSFTGFISAQQIRNSGAKYVIIGHSERRKIGETDDVVAKKLIQALRGGLLPILCVGEQVRDGHGNYLTFVKDQLIASLALVEKKDLKNIIIAYEPVWAIGRSDAEAMQPTQIHEMGIYIRKVLSDLYQDQKIASKMMVLYGGSVSSAVAEGILKDGEVDGLLVGRQSLQPDDFIQIIAIAHGV